MMKIQSRDEQGFLNVSLRDVLSAVGDAGKRLDWYIYWVEGTANPDSNLDIVGLENEVRRSPAGKAVTWKALTSLADRMFQVTDGLFLATLHGEEPPARSEAERHHGGEIVLELEDSSYWLISVQDPEVAEAMRHSLHSADVD